MKRYVCAVFDSAVQSYGQPFFVPHIGQAVRSFGDEVNRQAADNSLHRHSDDYHLSYLAVYDDETGTFSEQEVRVLARGKDVKQS